MMWYKTMMGNSVWPFGDFFVPFITLVVVDLILRGMALWKSAQAKQKGWFIALLIVNSMGILPLVYLAFFKPKKKK